MIGKYFFWDTNKLVTGAGIYPGSYDGSSLSNPKGTSSYCSILPDLLAPFSYGLFWHKLSAMLAGLRTLVTSLRLVW